MADDLNALWDSMAEEDKESFAEMSAEIGAEAWCHLVHRFADTLPFPGEVAQRIGHNMALVAVMALAERPDVPKGVKEDKWIRKLVDLTKKRIRSAVKSHQASANEDKLH